jgi:hypothetical protein
MVEITVMVPADKVETIRRCADLLASGSPEGGAIERVVERARLPAAPVSLKAASGRGM